MVNSFEKQLEGMEKQIAKLEKSKVGASAEKKKAIEANIKAIRAEIDKVSVEDIPVLDTRPKPTGWVKVNQEQVNDAQKAGKLYGFDPDKKIALIRE